MRCGGGAFEGRGFGWLQCPSRREAAQNGDVSGSSTHPICAAKVEYRPSGQWIPRAGVRAPTATYPGCAGETVLDIDDHCPYIVRRQICEEWVRRVVHEDSRYAGDLLRSLASICQTTDEWSSSDWPPSMITVNSPCSPFFHGTSNSIATRRIASGSCPKPSRQPHGELEAPGRACFGFVRDLLATREVKH